MCDKTKNYVSKFQEIVYSIIKMFIDHKKDLKAIIMMFTKKKLIGLH